MADPAAKGPIGGHEARSLFRGLEAYGLVALGVSGGRDSMALLRLLWRWAAEGRGKPGVVALTVDHGLRRGSAKEAEQVGHWCGALGTEHHILTWKGAKPEARVEEKAREARYRLLVDWCKEAGADALVLAHQQEDQAETVLMRLARASGIDGLAGMAPRSLREDLPVLRPLLTVPRARLTATLKELRQDWIDDPSNENPAVERVRLRAAADQLAALGLTAQAIAGTAQKLSRAAEALAEVATAHGRACVRLEPAGYALIDRAGFAGAPEEIRRRILADVLARVGGGSRVRDAVLERAVAGLEAEEPAPQTLARCRVLAHGRRAFLVARELRDQKPVALSAGDTVVWDGRFEVSLATGAQDGPVELLPLGEAAFGSLRRRAGHLAAVPGLAGAALPGGFVDDELVLAPEFGAGDGLRVRFLGLDPPRAADSPSS